MRIIDIASASSFALLCLAVIVTMNPLDERRQTESLIADSLATTALTSYLSTHNLHFLASATLPVICRSLAGWGNASTALDVKVNGASCNRQGDVTNYSGHSELSIQLPGRDIEVDAWVR